MSKALTVKELRDALTKLIEENPKAGDLIVVTSDSENYEYLPIESPTFPFGNFTKYDDGESLFLTEDDYNENDSDVEYVENAVCISY